MAGAFRPGDVLIVRDVAFEAIRPGDVIAFRAPGSAGTAHLVVHRVVARAPGGLITQGDANAAPDAARVQANGLVGRVTQAQRGTRVRPAPGGLTGRWHARWTRLRARVRRRVVAIGRAPYRWRRASGLARRLWRPAVTRVTMMTTQGTVVKYLCGARAVAEWRPETRAYWCEKPYDLVLDAPERE